MEANFLEIPRKAYKYGAFPRNLNVYTPCRHLSPIKHAVFGFLEEKICIYPETAI